LKLSKIAAGHHSAAISEEGHLYIWGSSVFGEILTPVNLSRSGNQVLDVSIGTTLAVAIDKEGNSWAWGANSEGELGIGDQIARSEPSRITCLKDKPLF
jgi:alpha-tubulin suppressor-like RCC1 family protein